MEMAKLTLVLSDNGQVAVSGPIENPVLCYGMLERARDAIKDFNDRKKAGEPSLVLAGPGAVPPPPDHNGKSRLPTG